MTAGPRGARVLVSAVGFGRVADVGMRLLREAGTDVVLHPGETAPDEETMRRLVRDADAVIAGTEPITAAVLAAAPRLRVIARRGVGTDSVDVVAATARGVAVTVTAGALTEAVADHTMGLLLAVARRIAAHDRRMKAGAWERVPGTDVHGKTLGIVGFGAIGRAVARRAAAFGMRLLACDPQPDVAAAAALGVRLCELPELLAASDAISLHVPLVPATRGLIGTDALARMKPGAILVNTSRGGVVDETALAKALRDGRLAGAGLDVYREEPTPHAALVALETVVATPHVASYTVETTARMEEVCARAVLAVLRGERPEALVNPEVYDRRSSAPNARDG
ncbi:MAG: phosphoglycerate dehydrogenase [Armatimonadota bacterium]|nr:phosphoglycerate dehydrogenase [Armatimonadota bacterium]MDR7456768.1 phosphoglycerate dehydrogenase [Armatimonadota bacterium]MDR7510500.1 phosphoglycerate dehydrogenase [Armatimonadota bacterium]